LGACSGDAGKSYAVTFVCETSTGSDCPTGQPCPEVPPSNTSCGDLPGLFGHPATPETTSRPIGWMVALPYGNPYYSDSQQTCICMPNPAVNGAASWVCPL
jgi:hypothetical protein